MKSDESKSKTMLYKQNPLTGDWLCYIPNTPQAYYYSSKKKAAMFCDKINAMFDSGKLKLDENTGSVKLNNL